MGDKGERGEGLPNRVRSRALKGRGECAMIFVTQTGALTMVGAGPLAGGVSSSSSTRGISANPLPRRGLLLVTALVNEFFRKLGRWRAGMRGLGIWSVAVKLGLRGEEESGKGVDPDAGSCIAPERKTDVLMDELYLDWSCPRPEGVEGEGCWGSEYVTRGGLPSDDIVTRGDVPYIDGEPPRVLGLESMLCID